MIAWSDNTRKAVVALVTVALVLLLLALPHGIHAQSTSIAIWTNTQRYNEGDTVFVYGMVYPVVQDRQIIIDVYKAGGSGWTFYAVKTALPSNEGGYSLTLDGLPEGYYAVVAWYSAQYAYSSFTVVNFGHPLNYKVFYLTSLDKCLPWNYYSMWLYNKEADSYLNLYGVQHARATPSCLSEKEFSANQWKYVAQYQTVIIVADYFVGYPFIMVHEDTGGGLMEAPQQGKDVVLVCDCLWENLKGGAVWTLSHELSHLVLKHKGYPLNTWVGWVHSQEFKWRDCSDLSTCTDVWTSIKIGTLQYTVMKPYTR